MNSDDFELVSVQDNFDILDHLELEYRSSCPDAKRPNSSIYFERWLREKYDIVFVHQKNQNCFYIPRTLLVVFKLQQEHAA